MLNHEGSLVGMLIDGDRRDGTDFVIPVGQLRAQIKEENRREVVRSELVA